MWVGAIVAGALVIGGAAAGRLAFWACVGENRPTADDEGVCEFLGTPWSLRWSLIVLWPAVVVVATSVIPPLRQRARLTWASVTLLVVVFWAVVLAIVVDV